MEPGDAYVASIFWSCPYCGQDRNEDVSRIERIIKGETLYFWPCILTHCQVRESEYKKYFARFKPFAQIDERQCNGCPDRIECLTFPREITWNFKSG